MDEREKLTAMKQILTQSVVSAILILSLLACYEEIFPIKPPNSGATKPGVGTVCQTPPIEKNIVGTWHFWSNLSERSMSNSTVATMGMVTFDAQGNITDPDSLFQNYLPGIAPVISKTYNPKVASQSTIYSGDTFEVYLNIKRGGVTRWGEIRYYVPVVNKCDSIVLAVRGSQDYALRFTLTR